MSRSKFTCGFFITVVLAVFAGKAESRTCWSEWVNNAKPATDGSEHEKALPTELTTLCLNGVISAQCADDKGEPFIGNKTDNVSRFNVSCSMDHGLVCRPWDSSRPCTSTNTVLTTTTTTTSASLSNRLAVSAQGLNARMRGSTVAPLTNASPGSNPNQRQRVGTWAQCGNGSPKRQYSTYVIVVMVAINMFVQF